MEANKVEIKKVGKRTEIKINGEPIKFVGKYSITQDMHVEHGLPMLEIKMVIDEETSSITL